MCGRLTLYAEPPEIADHFELERPPALHPRYNVAPGQLVAAVTRQSNSPKRVLSWLKWGLIPWWAETLQLGPIKAKGETVDRLDIFREFFQNQRCIIPASGFFEFREVGKRKIPYHFRSATGGLLGLAGIWSLWEMEGKRVFSIAVITTKPNATVEPYHDRMPVILAPEEYARWEDNETPLADLKALLKPYPAELLEVRKANPLVNNWRNEGPEMLAPDHDPAAA